MEQVSIYGDVYVIMLRAQVLAASKIQMLLVSLVYLYCLLFDSKTHL